MNLAEYGSQYFKMSDSSAIEICMVLDGTYAWVDPADETRGARCSFEAKVWTGDKSQAEQFCASKVPFYITEAESDASNGRTRCTFQVNLKCADSWVQISNRCYKTTPVKSDQTRLNETCKPYAPVAESPAHLATIYSDGLLPFLEEFLPEISTAWVQVSDMSTHFVNAAGDKAVLVMNGHLHDVKAGSLVLDRPDRLHRVLCEYSPVVTMAEIVYLAQQYDAIYPLFITPDGASFSSASYATVTHSGGSRYDVAALDNQCRAIGNIFGVNSNAYSSFEESFNEIKDHLTNHRFHLTAGLKDDNCKLGEYKDRNDARAESYPGNNNYGYCDAHSLSFAKGSRFPTKAAMRAPVLCNFEALVYEYGDCEPNWIKWVRAGDIPFCHYSPEKGVYTSQEGHDKCFSLWGGAQLTGFDSFEEVVHVIKTGTLRAHFHIGGVVPCDEHKMIACWRKGSASNNRMFDNHHPPDESFMWTKSGDTLSLSSESDPSDYRFHTHGEREGANKWTEQRYICGKGAQMASKKKVAK